MTASAILAFVNGLISLANVIAGYLDKQQLLDAGKAMANASNLQKATDAYRAADAARRVIGDTLARDPDWLPPSDPNAR